MLISFAEVWMFETTYACENDNMHLSCESSNVLEIQRALYGGATESICREDKESVRTCAEFDRTEALKLRCDNQTQCHILALTRTFGDPCPALRKFLNVVYACGKNSFMCVINLFIKNKYMCGK